MDAPATEAAPAALGQDSAAAGGEPAAIAGDTAAFIKAWARLVSSEAAVARASLSSLLIGALLVPALAFALLVALDAVLATLLFELTHHWLLAAVVVLVLDAAALLYLLRRLRNWWRTLSLPHSRQALTRLWSSHDDPSEERATAPARRAA